MRKPLDEIPVTLAEQKPPFPDPRLALTHPELFEQQMENERLRRKLAQQKQLTQLGLRRER